MVNKNKNVNVTPVESSTGTSPTLPKTQAPVKTIPNPGKSADAELPVQQPGVGAPVQTMGTGQNQPAATANAPTYTSMNQQVWGEGGTGVEGYRQVLELEKLYQQQNGSGSSAYSDAALRQQLIAAGIDPALLEEDSHKGGWTQNRDTAIMGGGTGERDENFYLDGDWYYYEGKPRPVTEGQAGADEQLLSDGAYAYVQYCKEMYANATTDEERAYWHNEAEKTRARAGYSGGADGSMYLTHGALGIEKEPQQTAGKYPNMGNFGDVTGGTAGGATGETTINGLSHVQTDELKALLEQWKSAAEKQANGQIDFATQQAITQLERALEDAQPQFKEQAESVSIDERRAMDNAALYAQLRGDQGGIGQEQYNSIQNTAAQNRLAVQQAQTKLSTDTVRQIEDLRAQGEFEKADKALEITQNYLSQLIGLEQWALEANLSVDQFNIQIQQWQKEYDMAMQELMMGQDRWEKEFAFQQEQAAIGNQQWQQQFDAALEQWGKEFGLSEEKFKYDKILDQLQTEQNALNQSAELGWAMLEVGMVNALTDEQLSAMGFKSRDQAQAYYNALAAQSSKTEIGSSAGFKDVSSTAKKYGSPDLTDKYLGGMVDAGVISLEEADYIFRVLCGYSYDSLTKNKYILEGDNLNIKNPVHYGSGEYSPVIIS